MKKLILSISAIMFLFIVSPSANAATEGHPAGTLVISSGTIYRVADDVSSLLSFESAEKFLSNFHNFSDAVPMNAGDKAKPVSGPAPWGEGRLFNDNGTIYQVSNNLKRGFSSAEVFLSYGFKFSQPVAGHLDLPVGPVVDAPDQAHLSGTFVINNGAVWLVTPTGRKGLSAPEVLLSLGRTFADVVPANAADMATPDAGLLSIRTGTLINDNGTVWVIGVGTKKSFPSAECFTNFGYSFAKVLTGATHAYTNVGSICGPEPSNKYLKTTIQTSRGNFSADIMTFNLANGDIKVTTSTANPNDCANDCPVKSLATYVAEAGGFAAMNGTYFCPAAYPECAGKVNTFYWKVYNSALGKMINATNNIKEEMPFVAFNNSQATYFSRYESWMDSPTPITAGINSEPRLVENGANVLNESTLDSKQLTVKSNRGAIGLKGQVVYCVIVRSATIPDLAGVMQALGVDNAVNLDGGGSSAMIYENSYKVGPGRDIPNAIIFSRQ